MCNTVSTVRLAVPIDRRKFCTSTASGKSRSMCASSIFRIRSCVWSSSCRLGEMMREPVLGGTLAQPLDPDRPFQHVAVEDVAVFAAIAFEQPDEWIGREVDIAGDEHTMPEIAETFSRVIGREVPTTRCPGTNLRSRWAKCTPSCTVGSTTWVTRRI